MIPGYLSEVFVSFQGEGVHAGRRHLFVRCAGCHLRCRYCDTPGSLERCKEYVVHRHGRPATIRPNPVVPRDLRELIQAMIQSEAPVDAIALTGGEPLLQPEFLAAVFDPGSLGCPVLLETSGTLLRPLHDVLPYVDIVSMDMKLPSNTGERPFWDEHAAFLALAIAREVAVKILVDQTTDEQDVERAAALIAHCGRPVPTILQPITGAGGRLSIDAERLERFYASARRHIDDARVLPQIHRVLNVR